MLTDDIEGASTWVNVQWLEAAEAGALSIHNIIATLEGVGLAIEIEREVGEVGHFVARHGISVPRPSSANPGSGGINENTYTAGR